MDSLDYKENKDSLSFQIHQKPRSDSEFHLTGKDAFFGFEEEADLAIKHAPLFLTNILDVGEDILICQNVRINSEGFYPDLFERYFVRLASKALAELYRFNLFYQLSGVLILLPQTELTSLTELQKLWLKDFGDLFSYRELSSKGVHQLYLPTNLQSFQHYSMLHALLEQSISSNN